MHYPPMWKFRLLKTLKANGNTENRRLLKAWGRAEGGSASNNPLNTTYEWPGATVYNSAGVKNYPTGTIGIAATADTLELEFYKGIVADLRAGTFTAKQIVERNAGEFNLWGTGAPNVLAVLNS